MRPLFVVACILALVPAASARAATDPIEGTWSRVGAGAGSAGGTITIRATRTGTLTGTVVVAYTSSNGCGHPVGKAVWLITRSSSGAYAGTNSGFAEDVAQNCPAQLQSTTWRLVSATQLEVCITSFGCATWTRPAPAASSLSLTLLRKRFDVAAAHRPFCNAASGASTVVCTVVSGVLVTICNRDVFHHGPLFSFDQQNRFKSAPVRPGTCFQRRFVNARAQLLTVTIYDEIHSQERVALRVLPRA
jgi:hypothetical protein